MSFKSKACGFIAALTLSACASSPDMNPFEKTYWNESLLEQIARGESRGIWENNPLIAWRRGGALTRDEAELFYANGDRVRARFADVGDGRLVFKPADGRALEKFETMDDDVFQRERDRHFFSLAPSKQDFREAVNRRFFYGSFRVLTADGRETDQIVDFLPNGRLNGTDRFIHYRLCMSPGCAHRYRGEVINLFDGQTWHGMILSKKDGQWLFSSVKPDANGYFVADRVYLRLLPISED